MSTYYRHWWPGRRSEQLHLGRTWLEVIADRGATWGIAPAKVTELQGLIAIATGLLDQAMSSDRTKVITEECNLAFRDLKTAMTTMKNRFFHCPPLSSADLTALLLLYDGIPTEIPAPGAMPTGDLLFPGVGLIEIRRIRPVDPSVGDPRSNDGARIWFGLEGTPTDSYKFRVSGEVKSGKDLPNSVFTQRSKERFEFPGESGNRVHFCMQFEHRGAVGPWGPVLSAVIP